MGIKIISNPYKQEICYEEWNKSTESWTPITAEGFPNSKLISKELKNGFFPFKVIKIVDQIIEEYHINEPVDVFFEGTEDEYDELFALCQAEYYANNITLHKSETYLENARDILPSIRNIFKEQVYPLVTLSINDLNKVKQELDKFSDASNDIIPICVLGTYSAGKSTFINALIGSEILPSAERPTTAKIYKLMQSDYSDRASITFTYDGKKAEIYFTANEYKLNAEDNNLIYDIKETLKNIETKDIYYRLKTVLELVNDFERDAEDNHIHDLIEIRVPFKPSIWTQALNKFVVFDTPGSNSASNEKHLQVLKKAMAGLTNGIPVFVTKFDQLDTTDNEKLYEEINSMKELDTRFTMIVVNKADTSSLPKDGFSERDKKDILNQAVPKKMYSGGIFFLSSVMGLGSKNAGNFIDDHSAEIFEDQKIKYSDPDSRFYKRIYQYNIMPEQLKKKSMELATECNDLVLANSGLSSVEEEIKTFAEKYASYNKCEQSKLFLGQIIDITADEISTAKARREKSKQDRMESLERDKKILVQKIDDKGISLEQLFTADYPDKMMPVVRDSVFSYEDKDIYNWNSDFTKKFKEELGYKDEVEDVKSAAESIRVGLKENVSKFASDLSLDSFKRIGLEFVETVKDTVDEIDDWNKIRIKVEKSASEALLENVSKDFDARFNNAKIVIEDSSKEYWENATKNIKGELVDLIAESSELTAEKRKELAEIVIKYKDIVFEKHTHDMFDKSRFQKKGLFGETGKLYLNKITKTYNVGMEQEVNEMYKHLHDDHETSFISWMKILLETVIDNIVDYSPSLHNQSLLIIEETEKIKELEQRQNQLNGYSNEIKTMMDWKVQ